jgi:CspA family cold shock protein
VTVTGTVRTWDAAEGWGVVDSPETPGGCWAHFSAVAVDGYRALVAGQAVALDWEQVVDQDGYRFRAVRVVPA